jgi:hypothetical protein
MASTHLDIAIGLCGQLHKAKLVKYAMQLNLCEQNEVIALLFCPVVNPNILSLQLPSMGLLLLVKRNIVILIIGKGSSQAIQNNVVTYTSQTARRLSRVKDIAAIASAEAIRLMPPMPPVTSIYIAAIGEIACIAEEAAWKVTAMKLCR